MVKGISQFEPGSKREQVSFVPTKEGERRKWERELYVPNSTKHDGLEETKKTKGVVTRALFKIYTDPKKLSKHDRERIEEHFELRIQLFFLQIIACYGVPYHFECEKANDQYGKGGTYKLKNPGKGPDGTVRTEAAHSSTLPCINAYPLDEWEGYEEGGPKPQPLIYLKHSHLYIQHNGTRELAKWVNRADCLIDGTSADSRLRNKAIELLNEAAKGIHTPQKGIKIFCVHLKEWIEKAQRKLESQDREADPRYLILNIYKKQLEDIRSARKADPGYFDHLVGVNIKNYPKEEILRKVVYKKRFELIQNCAAIESQIARHILDKQNKMLGKKNRSLSKVDDRLRYVLLEKKNCPSHRLLTRLFGTSIQQLRTGIEKDNLEEFEKKMKIPSFRKEHKKDIVNLEGLIQEEFGKMIKLEYIYRAELFKGLKEDVKGWDGVTFRDQFNKRYPKTLIGSWTITRIEQPTRKETRKYKTPLCQRTKKIDEKLAKKLAKTLGVDLGLFLPGIPSSMY